MEGGRPEGVAVSEDVDRQQETHGVAGVVGGGVEWWVVEWSG